MHMWRGKENVPDTICIDKYLRKYYLDIGSMQLELEYMMKFK